MRLSLLLLGQCAPLMLLLLDRSLQPSVGLVHRCCAVSLTCVLLTQRVHLVYTLRLWLRLRHLYLTFHSTWDQMRIPCPLIPTFHLRSANRQCSVHTVVRLLCHRVIRGRRLR